MSIELLSQWAGIGSFILSLLTLGGIRMVYKKLVVKQENQQNIVVNRDAIFNGSFNVSNKVEKPKK